MNHLSQTKGIPVYLLFHLENHPYVFIALGKGKVGQSTICTSGTFRQRYWGNGSECKHKRWFPVNGKVSFSIKECAFKVANLTSGYDDNTVCRLLSQTHPAFQIFSDPLTLFQIIIEETKPTIAVLLAIVWPCRNWNYLQKTRSCFSATKCTLKAPKNPHKHTCCLTEGEEKVCFVLCPSCLGTTDFALSNSARCFLAI